MWIQARHWDDFFYFGYNDQNNFDKHLVKLNRYKKCNNKYNWFQGKASSEIIILKNYIINEEIQKYLYLHSTLFAAAEKTTQCTDNDGSENKQ